MIGQEPYPEEVQQTGQPAVSEAGENAFSFLAWAGWQFWMPESWQPLKLLGTTDKGQMIVGNHDVAIFSVKWARPQNARITDGCEWVRSRLGQHGAHPQPNPPAAEHFTAVGWARDLQTEEGKETTYWYGYSEKADLLLGITLNGVLDKEIRRIVVTSILPTLRATPLDTQRLWSMYEVQFTVPAGFELMQRHLFAGDVALLFAKGRQETLLVRQVYPGDLALKRRSWEKWLNVAPFKEHRRLRPRSMQARTWRHPGKPDLSGMVRRGWKRIPAPLGWYAPRSTAALGVHDQQRNRLLIAEHAARGQAQESMCCTLIDGMNRFPATPQM